MLSKTFVNDSAKRGGFMNKELLLMSDDNKVTNLNFKMIAVQPQFAQDIIKKRVTPIKSDPKHGL